MPAIESELYTYLQTQAGLTALVSDRIYPMRGPEIFPGDFITYQKLVGSRLISHQGDSNLATVRFQFSCWSPDYLAAKEVARQVVKALSGFNGTMGTTAAGGTTVELELDDYDEQTRLHRTIIDVRFLHRESIT